MNAKRNYRYIGVEIYRCLLFPMQTLWDHLLNVFDPTLGSKWGKSYFSHSKHFNALTKKSFAGSQWASILLVVGMILWGNCLAQNSWASDSSETPWTTPTGEKIKQIGIDDSTDEEIEPLPLNVFKNKTTEFTISSSEMEKPPILLVQGNESPAEITNDVVPSFLPVSPVSPVPTELPAQPTAVPEVVQNPVVQDSGTVQNSAVPAPVQNSVTIQNPGTTAKRTSNSLEKESLPSGVISPEDVLSGTDLQEDFNESIVLPDGTNVPLKTDDRSLFDPLRTQQNFPQQLNKSPSNLLQNSQQSPNIPNLQSQQSLPQMSTQMSNGMQDTGTYGNIGNLGTRLEDGSMIGNPYAVSGSEEYHPSLFYGGQPYEMPTGMPPVEVYGQDMNGNPSYCCQSQLFQKLRWTLQNTTFDMGILGFRNPLDLNNSGNFGADIAINWSTPQRFLMGLTAQGGGRLTQTALNGYSDTNGFDYDDARTQLFWTSGLFYRSPMSPWQIGAVYDSLNDTYYRKYTLGQARVEVSRRFNGTTDIGFRGAFRVHDDLTNLWRISTGTYIKDKAQVTSYYTGFIRKYFEAGGEGMLFGGVTEWSEGLIGGQIEIPINDCMTLKNSFTYVFANDREVSNLDEQTWNVSAGITIYLGKNSRESMRNPLRPMFDVADNGTFLQNFKR